MMEDSQIKERLLAIGFTVVEIESQKMIEVVKNSGFPHELMISCLERVVKDGMPVDVQQLISQVRKIKQEEAQRVWDNCGSLGTCAHPRCFKMIPRDPGQRTEGTAVVYGWNLRTADEHALLFCSNEHRDQFITDPNLRVNFELGCMACRCAGVSLYDIGTKDATNNLKNYWIFCGRQCINNYFSRVSLNGGDTIMVGKKCGNCNHVDDGLMLCSRCQCLYYCNEDCQKADWKRHKKYCEKFKKASAK